MKIPTVVDDDFSSLYRRNLIPLHGVLVGLTWILHDYLITLHDEVRYVWPQKRSFSKFMFLWIRYYSVALLIFDVCQIHIFAIPGIKNEDLCVMIDPVTRIAGAINLWSVEIILQLRVYALYKCSKRVAWINGVLFASSIAGFLWILIYNASRRRDLNAGVIHLPLPGCPPINSGIQWAQWVPATAFEGVLFGFALYKTSMSTAGRVRTRRRVSLYSLLLRDNILYFSGISVLLVFNNLMVVGVTKIPWFSFGPFHAAIGVLTTRMFLNLRKATSGDEVVTFTQPSRPLVFHQTMVLTRDHVQGMTPPRETLTESNQRRTRPDSLLPPLNFVSSSGSNDWYAEIVNRFDQDVRSWFDGERET